MANKHPSKKRYTAIPKKAKAVKPAVKLVPEPAAAVEPPILKKLILVTPAPSAEVLELIARLKDRDADIASGAAAALGSRPFDAVVAALSAAVVNADGYFHPVVRAAAAESLGRLKDPRALPALMAGVRDRMAEASAEAVRALASIGDTAALQTLATVIENPGGYFLPVVRLAAVKAMLAFGDDERALVVLREVAHNDREDAVIRAAARG